MKVKVNIESNSIEAPEHNIEQPWPAGIYKTKDFPSTRILVLKDFGDKFWLGGDNFEPYDGRSFKGHGFILCKEKIEIKIVTANID